MILCCGEALIDMIPSATAQGTDGFVPHTGGAVFNTAVALGRLGATSGMLSGVSTDFFGQLLEDGLTESHVDTEHLIRSDRPTTLAFVRLQDGHATYSFYDENSAGRMLTEADVPALSDDISTMFFGGISLACEPGADMYAGLLSQQHKSKVIMLDPNIRPGFISDAERYRARLEAMISRADIVKVSDEDLNWIHPGDDSLEDKVAALQANGPHIVILTRGSEGASGYLRGGGVVHVPIKKVKVVDTVGAGDTFNAGFLAFLSKHDALGKDELTGLSEQMLSEALSFAASVASVTVSRAGANPPWLNEVPT